MVKTAVSTGFDLVVSTFNGTLKDKPKEYATSIGKKASNVAKDMDKYFYKKFDEYVKKDQEPPKDEGELIPDDNL